MNENQPTEEKGFSNTPSYTELNSAYQQSIEKENEIFIIAVEVQYMGNK